MKHIETQLGPLHMNSIFETTPKKLAKCLK